MKDYEEVKKEVKKRLSEKRFYHSQCVEERCIEFAKIYGANIEKARLIGIAHDIAKEMSHEEKIAFLEKRKEKMTPEEIKSPGLLHGKVGAIIAKEELDFDNEMIEAIANHTTGNSNMTLLSEILFVADCCSIDRKYIGTQETYELAKNNLKSAVIRCMDRTIQERIEKQKTIDPKTIIARNNYLEEIQNISK